MSYYNNPNFKNYPPDFTLRGPPPRNMRPASPNFARPPPNFGSPGRFGQPSPNFGLPPRNFGLPPPEFVPPPPPPPFFIAVPPTVVSDQDFLKQFDKQTPEPIKQKSTNISINEVKESLRYLVLTLNNLKERKKYLNDNINTIPEDEWALTLAEIKENKSEITEALSQINDTYLDTLRKLLTKRSAKRLRLKRVREERKKEKQEWIRDRQEKSRKIDENLQKIKDEIEKAKQEEKAKLDADIVLKEVLRKKHDAKKSITKLEAMQKLYQARRNTARGRGENPSETNAVNFNSNIDKLKAVWTHKLSLYDKEEAQLRAKLNEDNKVQSKSVNDEVLENLDKWREFLFGVSLGPQVDFQGDFDRFIAVRSQWDQFINDEGTPLPIGWVAPKLM